MQTLACQLSLALSLKQLLFSFERGTRVKKTLLQTLASCQLSSSLMQLLFSFDRARELRKLSCKLSLVNSHQLSSDSCFRSHQTLTQLSLVNYSTLINSHETLVLVWPGHESRENSHANSRLSSLINSQATLVFALIKRSRKLSLVNSHQLSWNSCSRLTRARELRKRSCKLSLVHSHRLN
jgi:hypothetical protein